MFSTSIQNDLNDAMKDINKIKNENATFFIVIKIDDMSDCSKKCQLIMIFRYVDESDVVQERFLGFSDVSANHSARALLEHGIKVVERLGRSFKNCFSNVRRASVMSGALSGTQHRVRAHFLSAIFVHWFASVSYTHLDVYKRQALTFLQL